ncbi:MAG: hypothetical protein JKP92_05135 [Alphaproteobacteria bacterium]|nr:hypothetical protein [Alphaproteobacteria bacterium]
MGGEDQADETTAADGPAEGTPPPRAQSGAAQPAAGTDPGEPTRGAAGDAFDRARTSTVSPDIRAEIPTYVANTKRWEGCRLTAYEDGQGKSIGYGHYYPNGDAPARITQAQADEFLQQDVEKGLAYLQKEWGARFTNAPPAVRQVMFDLMYNVGMEANTPFTPDNWPGFRRALGFVLEHPDDPRGYTALATESLRRQTDLGINLDTLKSLNKARIDSGRPILCDPRGKTQDQIKARVLGTLNEDRVTAREALLSASGPFTAAAVTADRALDAYVAEREALGLGGHYGRHDDLTSRNGWAFDLIEGAAPAGTAPLPGLHH